MNTFSFDELEIENIPRRHQLEQFQVFSQSSKDSSHKEIERPENIPHKRIEIRNLRGRSRVHQRRDK